MKKFHVIIFSLFLGGTSLSNGQSVWEHKTSNSQTNYGKTYYGNCTIGVASGKATTDGRPLVWKTQDTSPADQEVYLDTIGKYKALIIRTNGASVRTTAGVNGKGFAILNSVAFDLPGGGGFNLKLMYDCLGNCATVADFENYLDNTNVTGRIEVSGNFAVIDSTGAAAIFEIISDRYWKFDANDPSLAPNGYLVRTNFSIVGGANYDLGTYNLEILSRYNRSMKLIGDFYAGDSLNYRTIIRYHMRDFINAATNPIPVPYQDYWEPDLPYGYFNTLYSICRFSNVSAAAIQGVLPTESGKLTTMWAMLSDPATSIASPYWPVSETPTVANYPQVTPLCQVAYDIHKSVYSDTLLFTDSFNDSYTTYIDSYKLRDETGRGLWSRLFPAEDSIFNATEILMEKWRQEGLDVQEMSDTETSLAEYALSILQSSYDEIISLNISDDDFTYRPIYVYPNPFNNYLTIEVGLIDLYNIEITSINGQLILSREMEGTSHQIDLSSYQKGVYFITISSKDFVTTRKIIKL